MLATVLAFFGFVPWPAAAAVVTRRPTTPAPAPAPAVPRLTGLDHELVALRRQIRTAPQAVLTMSYLYAGESAVRRWTMSDPLRLSDQRRTALDARCREVLGAELYAYCRAVLWTRGRLPPVIGPQEFDPAYVERFTRALLSDARSEVDTWERAVDARAAAARAAERAGLPAPAPLDVPEAILKAMAARAAERAARLTRRGGGGGTGGEGPPAAPPPPEPPVGPKR